MTTTRFRPFVAKVMALLVICALAPAPFFATSAEGAATLTGQVLRIDGKTPRSGVTVVLVDVIDGRPVAEFTSAPTGDEGTFRIEGAPAGSYSLVVDTPEGAFLAAETITLTPGVNPRQVLTLRPQAPETTAGAGQSLGGVTWGQWVIAGAIVLAAAVVVLEVTDDVEEPASPF